MISKYLPVDYLFAYKQYVCFSSGNQNRRKRGELFLVLCLTNLFSSINNTTSYISVINQHCHKYQNRLSENKIINTLLLHKIN